MKSIGQIMEEMGFNPKSSASSKAAFIKYLAKQAYNVDLEIPEIYKSEQSSEHTLEAKLLEIRKKNQEPVQLELDLDFKKAE